MAIYPVIVQWFNILPSGMLIADLIFDFVAYWGELTDKKLITFCQVCEPHSILPSVHYWYVTYSRLDRN